MYTSTHKPNWHFHATAAWTRQPLMVLPPILRIKWFCYIIIILLSCHLMFKLLWYWHSPSSTKTWLLFAITRFVQIRMEHWCDYRWYWRTINMGLTCIIVHHPLILTIRSHPKLLTFSFKNKNSCNFLTSLHQLYEWHQLFWICPFLCMESYWVYILIIKN